MSIPPAPPQVHCERLHPGLPVPDVLAAAEFYTNKLGFSLGFTWGDPPAMAAVNLGDVQVFLERGTVGPEIDWRPYDEERQPQRRQQPRDHPRARPV